MNIRALLNSVSTHNYTLPIVILYVTAGCNLKCIMCSYRDPLPGELTLEEIEKLARELSESGLRRIVYSGGEPLTRRDFPLICSIFQSIGVNQSLLTNGLLLEKRFAELQNYLSELIISIDGPNSNIHNGIRGVDVFDRIIQGIKYVKATEPGISISIRMVVQRKNFRYLGDMVDMVKSIGADRISFLAADVGSEAFHRDHIKNDFNIDEIILTQEETREFRTLIESFIIDYRQDIDRCFISESPEKLFHLVEYFEALAGQKEYPRNVCNAPMMSTVITSTGDVLPCYFLPSYGNIRSNRLSELLNKPEIKKIRSNVKHNSLQRCRECVCTLNVRPRQAFADNF